MRTLITALFSLSLLALPACKTQRTTAPQPGSGTVSGSDAMASGSVAALEAGEWRLQAIKQGARETPVLEGHAVSLQFSQGELTGSLGCNLISGPYAIEGRIIDMSRTAVTERACEEMAAMDQEELVLELLNGMSAYRVDGTTLMVMGDGGRSLHFTRSN